MTKYLILVWVCHFAMITSKVNAQGEMLMNSLHQCEKTLGMHGIDFPSAGTLGFYLNGVAYPNDITDLYHGLRGPDNAFMA